MPNNLFKFKNGKFVMTEGYGSEITSEKKINVISESRKKVKKEAAAGTQYGDPVHDVENPSGPNVRDVNNQQVQPKVRPRSLDIPTERSPFFDAAANADTHPYKYGLDPTPEEIMAAAAAKGGGGKQSKIADPSQARPAFAPAPAAAAPEVKQPAEVAPSRYNQEQQPIMYNLTAKFKVEENVAREVLDTTVEWCRQILKQNLKAQNEFIQNESKYLKIRNPSKIIKHPSLVGVRRY